MSDRGAGLTGVHHRLPLGAPLAQLLGVLALQASSLLEARHDVAARLEGVLGPPHRPLVVPGLRPRARVQLGGPQVTEVTGRRGEERKGEVP